MKLRRKALLSLLSAFWLVIPSLSRTLPPLHVEGRSLVTNKGQKVTLHGVMDTPNPYFNRNRWGHRVDDEVIDNCIHYFDQLFSAITDTGQGAWCNVFRLHLDPCWTNDPRLKSDGRERGEADISRFSRARLEKYLKSLYWPIISRALRRGLYVVVRPPGVCPRKVEVDGPYQQYLMEVWNIVSQNDSIRKYSGQISLELANEPVELVAADHQRRPSALRDFFSPLCKRIRKNGFRGVIWLPGTGWQSHYEDYATHPVKGRNIGFAVHVYPGWYGASDDQCDSASFIRQFERQVPVVKSHPVLVSEVDWSPELPGRGHRNEFGKWIPGNMGTWATASTSRWGRCFKALLDYSGNISMTLTSTDDYIDVDRYLKDKTVVPAFNAHPEACGKACFEWYKAYGEKQRSSFQ